MHLPSKLLAPVFPPACTLHFAPCGIDADMLQGSSAFPYKGDVNLWSVGSMLFDPGFFEVAAPAFPDANFHVIGGREGTHRLAAPEIAVYPETSFKDILPYPKYAAASKAPCGGNEAPACLKQTSIELVQYGCLGLPAICPATMAGECKGRFGYVPGNPDSIAAAVRGALSLGRTDRPDFLSWAEVTPRVNTPGDFPDTVLN